MATEGSSDAVRKAVAYLNGQQNRGRWLSLLPNVALWP